jgi:hypothetical protein
VRIGFDLFSSVGNGWMVNLRPSGPLGESRGPLVGKGGKSDVESQHHQGCSPACVG